MGRVRSPNREKARQMYLESNGKMMLKDIAAELGVLDTQIRKWKSTDKWDEELKGTLPKEKRNVTNNKGTKKQSKDSIAEEIEEVLENNELTDKQKLFCINYAKCFNATKAYQKAYGCSYETAMVEGCKALRNPKISNQIEKLNAAEFNKEFLKKGIVQKYIDIAFSDITDYLIFGQEEVPVINAFGPVVDKDGKPVTRMVNTVKFRTWANVDGTLISEISQGKDGAKLKLMDKMKALQWLSDRVDLLPVEVQEKLKIEKDKLNGGTHDKSRAGIDEFIKATTMTEDEIKKMFESDLEGEEDV